MAKTEAATRTRMLAGEEKKALFLAARGWKVIAPDKYVLRCRCGSVVGMDGIIKVKLADAHRHEQWLREQSRDWTPVPVNALLAAPNRATWIKMCGSCAEADESYYWLTADHVLDPLRLPETMAHLSEKNWFSCTDWAALMRKLVS